VRTEEARKVPETADAVTVQLSALDDQVRRTGRVEIEQVQQVLDLVINAGNFESVHHSDFFLHIFF
jgi:hypothetical protein